MSSDQQHVKGYIFGLAAVIIWSGFILISRQGGLSELNHYDMIALRYGTCAMVLLPFWWFRQRFNLLEPKYWCVALVGGVGYALCTFQGFQLAPASHGALLLPGSMPLFIFLLAIFVGQTYFTVQKGMGILLITLGIVALFWQQLMSTNVQSDIIKGDALFLLGALCWGVFSILIKHWNIPPWHAVISMAVLTSVMYLPMYFLFAPKNIAITNISTIALQMVYQGIFASIIQLYFYVRAVEILGASGMGSLMALVPLISGIAAIFIFSEAVSFSLVLGLCLVAIGAWVTHSKFLQNNKTLNVALALKGE